MSIIAHLQYGLRECDHDAYPSIAVARPENLQTHEAGPRGRRRADPVDVQYDRLSGDLLNDRVDRRGMSLPPRFAVTSAQIDRVVARFYSAVRADPKIGPIFAAHVTDWPTHEDKITRFWRNAILFERSYDGNPMQAHMKAGNVTPGHFEPWLELFDAVLAAELPDDIATAWSALAHRIGRGLSFGLETYSVDAAPQLGTHVPRLN